MTADTMIDAGQQYWEVRFDKESKAFAVGVALRSLGRFDQLGKSSASWCIHLNNWLQQSLTAKHNNKARTLDCPIPNSIGVYVNYDEGTINTNTQSQCLTDWITVGLLNVQNLSSHKIKPLKCLTDMKNMLQMIRLWHENIWKKGYLFWKEDPAKMAAWNVADKTIWN